MKAVLILASLLLSAPMAFAQNETVNADDQIVEFEDGAMSQDAAAAVTAPNMSLLRRGERDRGAEIIGGVIGGIIGAIAAEELDRHPGHGGPGHGGPGGPGHGGPGGPGHGGPGGPGHGGPGGGWDRDFVCYARDHRGNLYRAAGPNARRVQDRAMDKCSRYSRFCRPQGCQRI